MKSAKKVWIFSSVCLIVAGFIIFLVSLVVMNFDLTRLNTVNFVTNTYTIEETFTDINISGAECNISFDYAKDGQCRVVCAEGEKISHTVSVVDDTLVIEREDRREWYERIGIYWGKMEIVVSLPESQYNSLYAKSLSGEITIPEEFTFNNAEIITTSGDINFNAKVLNDLNVKTTSGEIHVAEITPQNITVKATSGDIELENIECNTLTTDNTSGEINLTDVVVSGNLKTQTVSGDIELQDCDAKTLYLKSTSGEISGHLLTEKNFVTSTTSGDIKVPKSAGDDKCEIITTSGDIKFEIKK